MQHKKLMRWRLPEVDGIRGNRQDFPLLQRMVVPVLLLFCLLVVGL